MNKTVIVIPCYNEYRRLPADVFKAYSVRREGQSFLFVDDGSTDLTCDLLDHLNSFDHLAFNVLRLKQNSGKAEAVRQGFLTALQSRPDYIGYWDADLATPLEEISVFCRTLDESPEIEIVMGSRIALMGHKIDRRPIRQFLGRIASKVASFAAGASVYDAMCGAKCFRVTPRTISLFARPFRSRWMFDTEWLARYVNSPDWKTSSGFRDKICEMPVRQWRDVSGSKVRWYDFLLSAFSCCEIFLRYRCGVLPIPDAKDPLLFDGFLGNKPAEENSIDS